MTIFFGADHRGFDLKNRLIEYLQEKNIRVEDLGNYQNDPLDDFVDFSQKVAEAVLQNPDNFLGVVICGSGIGVSIAANRFKGIRCGFGFDVDQIKHAKESVHLNMLALPADYIDFEKAKKIVDVFISTPNKKEDKYLRRARKLDQ